MLNKMVSWIALLTFMPTWVMMLVIIFEEFRVEKVNYIVPNNHQSVDYIGPKMTLPKDDTTYMFYVNKD